MDRMAIDIFICMYKYTVLLLAAAPQKVYTIYHDSKVYSLLSRSGVRDRHEQRFLNGVALGAYSSSL